MMRMGMNETFNDHVHHVFLQLLPLFQSQDFAEGMASFMENAKQNLKAANHPIILFNFKELL